MCEIPRENASNQEIKEILEKSENIAVIGASADEDRDSYRVVKYLLEHGYNIYPVNPRYTEILGQKCYPDLKSIPVPIDIVDIFRKPEAIPEIVDEAIEIKAGAVWMQLGLVDNNAADKARKAGLSVIMCKCIKVEHMHLVNK